MTHKQGTLRGLNYDIVASSYADAISIMIYKNNKLGKVLRCRLYPQPEPFSYDPSMALDQAAAPNVEGSDALEDSYLEIRPEIQPTALLGSSSEDSIGQLYASVIASKIARESPGDTRTLFVGLGDIGSQRDGNDLKRQELEFVMDLVSSSRVW